MTLFTGSGVAIITPFTKDGVNYKTLEELIEFHIGNGTDSIVICGTTGEASTMPDEEHLETIRFTVEKVNKRVPVIAGTGSNDTEHGVKLTKKAYQHGADAVLVVTPYYNKTTQKGLYEYYEYIAKKVDIPIVLYNVPSRTGLNIEPKTVEKLSKIDTVIGLKEASGNISKITETMQLCGDRIDLYSGNDDQIVPLLSLGGKGVISVIANILPQQTHDLVQKYLDGDTKGSLEMQLKLLPIIQSMFLEVNPIPVKTAMKLMGIDVGPCRMPLTTMEEKNLALLKSAMQDAGITIQ